MILPADPTGRAERHSNRKLLRLLGLLAGVFVVGTGIGWIVGQIGHPVAPAGPQNVATTVPASLPPTSGSPAADALAPSAPEPPPQSVATPPVAAPPVATPQLPQPAAATTTDQRAATNFIAEATQQPPASTPPQSPPPAVTGPTPASKPLPVATPAPIAKSEPEVVIEPAQETPPPAAPAAAAKPKPAIPTAGKKPRADHPVVIAKAARHRPISHTAGRSEAATGAARVVVKGAKGAPAGTRWTIQLGAFRAHDHAAMLVMTLHSHGTEAKVIKRDDGAKGIWYIVQTPGVPSLQAATKAAAGISRRERVVAYVMRASSS